MTRSDLTNPWPDLRDSTILWHDVSWFDLKFTWHYLTWSDLELTWLDLTLLSWSDQTGPYSYLTWPDLDISWPWPQLTWPDVSWPRSDLTCPVFPVSWTWPDMNLIWPFGRFWRGLARCRGSAVRWWRLRVGHCDVNRWDWYASWCRYKLYWFNHYRIRCSMRASSMYIGWISDN